MSTRCPNAGDFSVIRPPGHSLWINLEKFGNFTWSKQIVLHTQISFDSLSIIDPKSTIFNKKKLLTGQRCGHKIRPHPKKLSSVFNGFNIRGGAAMKDMEIIHDFVNFLKTKSLGYQEICQYLVTVSLREFNFFGAIFTEIQKNGTVRIVASYGVDKKDVAAWQDIPIDVKTPVNDCLKENKVVWVNPVMNVFLEYQVLNNLPQDKRVQTLISIPIKASTNIIGSLSLLSLSKINIDHTLELLITTLCNLSALSSELDLKNSSNKHSLGYQTNPINIDVFKKLSERQLKIFSMLTEKKTNNEIAHQLGYSASTIKQETMNIYEILGIRGREDTYLLKAQLEDHLN